MATLGEVIKYKRLLKELSLRDFADLCGLSHSYIDSLEKGIDPRTGKPVSPTIETLEKIAAGLSLNLNDLLKRAGIIKDYILMDSIPINDMARIPIYGEVRAGQPMLVQEDITGYEYISAEDVRGGEYFFLKVKGDSMIGKRICEGDLVLVRKQPALEDGQIGVFIVEEEATIKTFHRQGNLAMLTPANSAYKPIVVLLKDLTIVGEVVEAKIKFNGR